MGITDYAQKALGDVVYVEVVGPGEAVEQRGEPVLALYVLRSRKDELVLTP